MGIPQATTRRRSQFGDCMNVPFYPHGALIRRIIHPNDPFDLYLVRQDAQALHHQRLAIGGVLTVREGPFAEEKA